MACWRVWNTENMKTFADYVKFYNNHDVLGFVQGLEKFLAIENEQGLDVFKESVSLASLTHKYLQRNLEEDDYFTGISEQHSHIYKDLRTLGITGGPSIIFHRYQEANVTKIKGKHLCKKVIGFDANALYLSCVGRAMPIGYYSLREKKNGYKRETNYSNEAVQWLEYLKRNLKIDIRHVLNSPHGEKRISNYSVDGFCHSNNTIYEYYGCFAHGHCGCNKDTKKWINTKIREKHLSRLGYNIVSITSCVWQKDPASKRQLPISQTPCLFTDIVDCIMNNESFGFVRCDIHVPEHLIPRFSEFPPIFKNTEIPISEIGDHMQAFCRSITRLKGVERS